MEDKAKICELLCATLQATREHSDLVKLKYEPIEMEVDSERVLAYYENRLIKIDVTADSGIAMIRDILRAIK